MTIQEMHDRFTLAMDEANAPWFTEVERDIFLNEAQDQLVRLWYKEFESTEEVRQALARLVEVLSVTFVQTAHTGVANLDALVMPNALNGSTAMYVLSLTVQVTDNCGRTKRRTVKPLHSNAEVQVTNDPFNKPSPREPRLHMEHDGNGDRRMRLYVGGENDTAPYPVIGANNTVRVLRSAQRMDLNAAPPVDCELPDHVHDWIVDRAVMIALENVGSDRLAGYSMLSNDDTP